ncbi:HIT domain-containing protein [Candidatus Falkowbacteria bacterium]|nr:HIT domain-containing protein [Candidatus Falkowbacteria bacterium]
MDCIFCEIVAGNIPARKVYEDDHFLAFLDIRPLNLGHTLVIPKKHYRWVWDLPMGDEPDNIGQYYKVVAKVAKALKKVFDIEQVKSVVLGDEVPHAHIWLIPAFENDGHGGAINFKKVKKIDEKEMEWVASKLNEELINK